MMNCVKCKDLTKMSEMGHRYCKKQQIFGPIRDVRILPAWCPKAKKKHNPPPPSQRSNKPHPLKGTITRPTVGDCRKFARRAALTFSAVDQGPNIENAI